MLGLPSLFVALVAPPAASPPAPAAEGSLHSEIPSPLARDARYLFYLRGGWLEHKPPHGPHPRYGLYRYEEIARALAGRGFVVIGELREGPVADEAYAEKVAAQVRSLLDREVPPAHITAAGHSKGGVDPRSSPDLGGRVVQQFSRPGRAVPTRP